MARHDLRVHALAGVPEMEANWHAFVAAETPAALAERQAASDGPGARALSEITRGETIGAGAPESSGPMSPWLAAASRTGAWSKCPTSRRTRR